MAKNLANLGIAWYSEDDEVQRGVGDLHESLDGIKDKLNEIKNLNAIQAVVDAVSLQRLNDISNDLSNNMRDIVSSTADVSGAAGPLDSYYTDAAQSASQLAASSNAVAENMGLIEEAPSLARSLNIDTDTVQGIANEFTRLGVNAERYGFSSMREFVELTQVANVEGEDLVATLRGLETGFDYSGDEAGVLLDEVSHIGREFGFGTEAIGQFDDITGELNEHLRTMGQDAGPEEFSEMTRQIYMLAGGMVELGKDPTEAMSAAQGVFTELAGMQTEIEQMFTGSGGVPDTLHEMATAMGDFDDAHEMIQEDPLDFILMMGENYDELNDQQQAFMDQNVLSEFEADVDWFVKGNWEESSDQIARLRDNMHEAEGSASDMADHYHDGRTYMDRLNMISEDYEQRMSDLTKDAMGDQLISNQRSMYLGVIAPAFESMVDGTFMVSEATEFMNESIFDMIPGLEVSEDILSGMQESVSKIYLGWRAAGFQGALAALTSAEPAMEALSGFAGQTRQEFEDAVTDGPVTAFNAYMDAGRGFVEEIRGFFLDIWDGMKEAYPELRGVERIFESIAGRAEQARDFVAGLLRNIGRADQDDDINKDRSPGAEGALGGLGLGAAAATLAPVASAIPGGNIIAGAMGIGGIVTTIQRNYRDGITGFLDDVGDITRDIIDSAGPYINDALDAMTEFFGHLFGMIDWAAMGDTLASFVGDFAVAISDAIAFMFGSSDTKNEMRDAAEGPDIQASFAVMAGTLLDGAWDAFIELGKGLISATWNGIRNADMATVGKVVGGLVVAGIFAAVASAFTLAAVTGLLLSALAAPIVLPIKFAFNIVRGTVRLWALSKALVKIADLSRRVGFAATRMGRMFLIASHRVSQFVAIIQRVPGIVRSFTGLNAVTGVLNTIARVLQSIGGVAPRAARSMTFLGAAMQTFRQSRVVGFFARFIKVLRPLYNFFLRFVAPIIGIYAWITSLPEVFENFRAILFDSLAPDELAEATWNLFTEFLGIIDFILLGLPSTIGKWFGLGVEHVEAAFGAMRYGMFAFITHTISFFKLLWPRIQYFTWGFVAWFYEAVSSMGEAVFDFVNSSINAYYDFVISGVEAFWDFAEKVAQVFLSIQHTVQDVVGVIQDLFMNMLTSIVWHVFKPMLDVFSETINGMIERLAGSRTGRFALRRAGFDVESEEDAEGLFDMSGAIGVEDGDDIEDYRENMRENFGVETSEEREERQEQEVEDLENTMGYASATHTDAIEDQRDYVTGMVDAGREGFVSGMGQSAAVARGYQENVEEDIEAETASRDRMLDAEMESIGDQTQERQAARVQEEATIEPEEPESPDEPAPAEGMDDFTAGEMPMYSDEGMDMAMPAEEPDMGDEELQGTVFNEDSWEEIRENDEERNNFLEMIYRELRNNRRKSRTTGHEAP